MTTKQRGKKKELSQAELARAGLSYEMTQLIESIADFSCNHILKSGMQEKPVLDLMVRFYKAVQSNTEKFDNLRPDSIICDAGVGKLCYKMMYNRQRNHQRSVGKDQLKSGRSPKKEDAITLFGKDEVSDSNDGKSAKSDPSAQIEEEDLANEPDVDPNFGKDEGKEEEPQPTPQKDRRNTRSQNKSKPKVGKLAEAKRIILDQFDLLDEDSFRYMFVELQDGKVKFLVEYPFEKQVVVKRY